MRTGAAMLLLGLGCASRRPPDTAALLRTAQADLAAGKAGDAQSGFEQVLSREPQELAAIRGRVEAATKRGALDALLRELQSPAGWTGFYALGLARVVAGDAPGGIEALRKASALRPEMPDIQYRIGVALLEGGKPAEAREPLTKAVQLAPMAARYRPALASCLGRVGDRKAAMEALRGFAALEPSADEAALAVKTAGSLTDLFRDVPPAARGELDEALGFLVREAPGLAVARLEGLLSRQPELAPAHALLGLAAARIDESTRAVAELKQAAALQPDLPQPHAWLAALYVASDLPEQALDEYEAALERNPLDAGSLRRLGELRLGRGVPGAIEALREAAALQPEDDGLQLVLARGEAAAGQRGAAEARLERLAGKRPGDAEPHLRLAALLYERRQQAPQAERIELTRRVESLLRKVLELQPGNATANGLLAALRSG